MGPFGDTISYKVLCSIVRHTYPSFVVRTLSCQVMLSAIVLSVTAGLLLPGAPALRVSDSLVEYKFSRADCLSGYAPDSSNRTSLFGYLNINTSSITCKGLGVEAKVGILANQRIVSSLNSSLFLDILGGREFTFEVWASFEDFSECEKCSRRHIVSTSDTDDGLIPMRCNASNFLFFQTNDEHSVGVRVSTSEISSDCRFTFANSTIEWGVPTHVVFTVTDPGGVEDGTTTFRWYLDGLLVYEDDLEVIGNSFTSGWLADFHLQLLGDIAVENPSDTSYAPPSGSIFLLAMYDRPLGSGEVAQNYEAGLQNSPPVAQDISAVINEDGEVGDHYDTPEYYLQDPMVPPLNLSTISLLVVDLDTEDGFPGFDAEREVVPSEVYIESLPSKGELFSISGQTISCVPYKVFHDNGYAVRYRPVKDEFSAPNVMYTSFAYSAIDAVTGTPSIVPGIVTVHVLAKNDPPVPTNTSETVTTGRENVLVLVGTDVDGSGGDVIEEAQIIDPPVHGVLYQVRHE